MKIAAVTLGAILAACGSAPPPASAPRDATKEPWYTQTVSELETMNRDAETFLKTGKPDDASALVQKGEPLSARLLAVPRPTLAAMQSASDLDDLYGRMLFSNRNYGWARLFFQKNAARWKYWTPQTPDTLLRLKRAQSRIDDCDRHLVE